MSSLWAGHREGMPLPLGACPTQPAGSILLPCGWGEEGAGCPGPGKMMLSSAGTEALPMPGTGRRQKGSGPAHQVGPCPVDKKPSTWRCSPPWPATRMWLCGASAGPVKPRQLIVYSGFPQEARRMHLSLYPDHSLTTCLSVLVVAQGCHLCYCIFVWSP